MTLTYQQTLGKNLKRIRDGRDLRQEDVALMAQQVGLRWTQATVAAIETGRRDVGLGEFWFLCRLLDVQPEALLATDEPVDVHGVLVASEDVRALVTGKRPRQLDHEDAIQRARLWADTDPEKDAIAKRYDIPRDRVPLLLVESLASAEQKAARKLGVDAFEVVCAAHSLWECSLTEYREIGLEDVPPGTDLRAKRGHITRRLVEELSECISGSQGRAGRERRPTRGRPS